MSIARQDGCKNLLLGRMAPDDFERLATAADLVPLERGEWLCQPGQRIETVFFPETGIASVTSNDGPTKIEIGLIGRDGFVGSAALLGAEQDSSAIHVQHPGDFVRLPAGAFLSAVDDSPNLRRLLHRYVHAYKVQILSTAVANGNLTVEQRLARWLLMAHDRIDGSDLALTHDFLATMLGVRRPGVTVATHVLESHHAIRATRGKICIISREKLKAIAGKSYGLAEAEYQRMIDLPA